MKDFKGARGYTHRARAEFIYNEARGLTLYEASTLWRLAHLKDWTLPDYLVLNKIAEDVQSRAFDCDFYQHDAWRRAS